MHTSSPQQSDDYYSMHASSGATPQPATTNRPNKKAGRARLHKRKHAKWEKGSDPLK
jgi:hypothetical protein